MIDLKFKTLAHTIAMREGKKVSVNQAQINEIVKIMLEELGAYTCEFHDIVEVLKFLHRYAPEGK